MAATFAIEEHTFEGQHIREYPRALASSQEDVIHIHAKSYTPHDVAGDSERADMTIIAFHANAFHKEVYEPFFEALYHCLKSKQNLTIGSIWIADQSNQGTSGLLNDGINGNDASWFDHARDVLTMTNTFRRRMKRPIIAVGHSMGGTQAVATAHLHPRLFEALVLIDAPISLSHSPSSVQMLKYALHQPEAHETREKAEKFVRKSPLFKGWDPRVVKRYIETAFHSDPIATLPCGQTKPKTTKHAETSTLVRSQIEHPLKDDKEDVAEELAHSSKTKVDPTIELKADALNTVPKLAWSWLPTLRPSTLFIHGEGSRVCRAEEREARTKLTGTAPGGSGGVTKGRVELRSVGGGHFAPMTNVDGTAEATSAWIGEEMRRFRRREREVVEGWGEQAIGEKQKVDAKVQRAWRRWEGNAGLREREERVKSRL